MLKRVRKRWEKRLEDAQDRYKRRMDEYHHDRNAVVKRLRKRLQEREERLSRVRLTSREDKERRRDEPAEDDPASPISTTDHEEVRREKRRREHCEDHREERREEAVMDRHMWRINTYRVHRIINVEADYYVSAWVADPDFDRVRSSFFT